MEYGCHWEIIADNFGKAGWSCAGVSALDSQGRTIWIADAHRSDESVVYADETLTAFVERLRARGDAGDSLTPEDGLFLRA